jgi:5'-deoxynucleotidase YfbR-like HD superfamily hydrolase
MALLHDWAETRVGDLPKTAMSYFRGDLRKRAETEAFADVVRESGSAASLYRELYDEYERRETLESRLVKAADVIDCWFKHWHSNVPEREGWKSSGR